MMLSQPATTAGNLNALAKMISNAGLQRVLLGEDYKKYGRQLKTLLLKSGAQVAEKQTFAAIIDSCYAHLLTNYRHEYLFKAALLNDYVLKNYSLNDTILLNEFRIGNSKADTVLVNGTNKVFEIKTELDSPERLTSQLADYYKAFSEVFIVVHHSKLEKYVQQVGEGVGIMTFCQNNIDVIRPAIVDRAHLDREVMVKALRKDEYLQVVQRLCGYIPETKPVHLFRACIDLLRKFAPDEVQFEFLKVIKQRIDPTINQIINNPQIPESLRLTCYYSNLSQKDYLSLVKRLSHQF